VQLALYKKNLDAVIKNNEVNTTNLLIIVSQVETLLLASREIRGNKGALTRAADRSLILIE
jgi:hypothetical protein